MFWRFFIITIAPTHTDTAIVRKLTSVVCKCSMASPAISFGALVTLKELTSTSPHFKEGASLRVTGKLQDYNVETAIATINDGGATLQVDTQHLKINFRISSIYQFIGELHIDSPDEAVLRARVGRNVDGIDLNLYYQSLKLLQEFQSDQIRKQEA